MDSLFTRLEEASHAGDVNSLKELLKEEKFLLEKVVVSTSMRDNPIHIAAMLGHADFVRVIVCHKPELAKELNSQGLSPLHLAAAHGHLTVVKELLKAGLEICLLSEKQEGLLPLHIAIKKRRTVIIKELVDACEEAVHRLTNGRETILHLAVKYNSFETVEYLIDQVEDLNAKDDRGNTILHHAVASKQLSVIKILLSKAAIDVNTMNLRLLTPLDVLLELWPQNGDLIIGEMIRASGGKTSAEVLSKSESVIRDYASNDSSNPIPTPRTSLQQPRYFRTTNDIEEATSKLKKPKKEKRYDSQILLLVATLVATVTFQATLNPPGGFKPDDKDHNITKGQPVLGDSLNYFQIYGMFALFSSVGVMMLLLCVVPRKKKIVMKLLVWVIWGAAFSMGLAFTVGIYQLYDYDDYYKNHHNINNNSTNTNTTTGDYDVYHYHDAWYLALVMLYGWLILLRLGTSWVLVWFLIFLLKKCGLWEPVPPCFASLKRGWFSKWPQFSNITKFNVSICSELFKKIICTVLILAVLAGITFVWVLSYQYFGI